MPFYQTEEKRRVHLSLQAHHFLIVKLMPFLKRRLVLGSKEIGAGRQHPGMDTDLKFLKSLWFQAHLAYLQNIIRVYWYIHIYLPGLFQNHDYLTLHSSSRLANRQSLWVDIDEIIGYCLKKSFTKTMRHRN